MAIATDFIFRIYVFVYKYMYVLHPYNLGGGAHRNSMGKENVRTYLYYFLFWLGRFSVKTFGFKTNFL